MYARRGGVPDYFLSRCDPPPPPPPPRHRRSKSPRSTERTSARHLKRPCIRIHIHTHTFIYAYIGNRTLPRNDRIDNGRACREVFARVTLITFRVAKTLFGPRQRFSNSIDVCFFFFFGYRISTERSKETPTLLSNVRTFRRPIGRRHARKVD